MSKIKSQIKSIKSKYNKLMKIIKYVNKAIKIAKSIDQAFKKYNKEDVIYY